MRFVEEDSSNDNEEVAVQMTRRELNELITTLRRAEELASSMRQSEHDFRLHQARLLRAVVTVVPRPTAQMTSTLPPPFERRDTVRFVETEDVADLVLDKKSRG